MGFLCWLPLLAAVEGFFVVAEVVVDAFDIVDVVVEFIAFLVAPPAFLAAVGAFAAYFFFKGVASDLPEAALDFFVFSIRSTFMNKSLK